MKIKNIKEIIFCNKNGKLAAFAKTYGNQFTEISIREGIKLASEIDYRILKNREEIEQLKKEVEYRSGNKSYKVASIAAAVAATGALVLGASACGLNRDSRVVNETGAAEMSQGTDSAAEETATPIIVEASAEQTTSEQAPNEEDLNSLLQASESATQRETIQMMYDYINYINGDFANYYKETVQVRDSEGNLTGEEIEVKPALLWDYEVPALTIAYNDYSIRELQEIFNGTELDANVLDANYKNGTLQLFGAYVISDRSHPVNLSALIESPEGKAFVQKYEDLYYNIKEAKTEEEQIEAVNAFYRELYRDFPIDDYTIEVGISHADSRSLILDQQYKLAITPIATAVEVMYQDLAIDHTLSDKAISYFDDLGLCNLGYSAFQKAERATESATYDERFADYEKLRRLIISQLRAKGYYVIDDIHRDLSQLTKFQELVNGHFGVIDGMWVFTGDSVILSTTVETYQEIVDQWSTSTTKTWTETETTRTSDRAKAVSIAGEDKVKEAERKVDQDIEEENQRAKEEAERRADEEQERQQREEDEHAQQVRDEVAQDEQDMDQKIDDANDKIDDGKTVTEDDFGGRVDFDDDHSDEHGKLDNSVENVTTDGTNTVDADDKLPSPEETESAFYERHSAELQAQDDDPEAFAYDYDEEVITTETVQPEQQTQEPEVEETYSTDDYVETVEPVVTDEYVDTTTSYEDYDQTSTDDYASDDYETDEVEAVYYDYQDIDYEEEYTTTSDEELVDAYVESLSEEQTTSTSKSL